MLVASTRRVTL